MRRIVRPTWLTLVSVLFLAAACASGGATDGNGALDAAGPAGATTLRVHNTDNAGETLTIFLQPAAGELIRLGTVAPFEYLTVAHPAAAGRFQLRAERPAGGVITSPGFNVVSGTYTWDIALRRVERAR